MKTLLGHLGVGEGFKSVKESYKKGFGRGTVIFLQASACSSNSTAAPLSANLTMLLSAQRWGWMAGKLS